MENKPFPYLQLLKTLAIFVLAWLVGSGLYFFTYKIFAFSSLNTLTSLFSLFLLSIVLKINYQGITGISIRNNRFYRSSKFVILSIHDNGFSYEE